MLGEIRDEETAAMAVHAALTGHLVLSTLHTNDAIGAVYRLLDMGIADYLLAAACVVCWHSACCAVRAAIAANAPSDCCGAAVSWP